MPTDYFVPACCPGAKAPGTKKSQLFGGQIIEISSPAWGRFDQTLFLAQYNLPQTHIECPLESINPNELTFKSNNYHYRTSQAVSEYEILENNYFAKVSHLEIYYMLHKIIEYDL